MAATRVFNFGGFLIFNFFVFSLVVDLVGIDMGICKVM